MDAYYAYYVLVYPYSTSSMNTVCILVVSTTTLVCIVRALSTTSY